MNDTATLTPQEFVTALMKEFVKADPMKRQQLTNEWAEKLEAYIQEVKNAE